MAANAQGKFWEMHDKMFANQQAARPRVAREVRGRDRARRGKFKADLDSGKYKDEINKDVAVRQDGNVTGTPAFFINGHFINGAMPFENFASVIDGELKRSTSSHSDVIDTRQNRAGPRKGPRFFLAARAQRGRTSPDASRQLC